MTIAVIRGRRWLGWGIVLALAACGPEASPPPKALEVVTARIAHYAPISRTISLAGTVTARVESRLSFRTNGQIASRRVDVGDHIRAGEVLATLETREQQADLAAAEAGLRSAEATLAQATSAYERQSKLLESGFTTRSAFDAAQEAWRAATSAVEAARADLGTARDRLSFTVLTADADGVIIARDAEAGQVVAAAQTVFALAWDGERDATFDIYEALLADAPPSERIAVSLLGDRAVTAEATVREVSPIFDTATGTVRVKTALIDPPAAMNLGSAVLGVGVSAPRHLVALPWTALSAQDGQPAVWLVDPATATVRPRLITVAQYRTGDILVGAGLADGDLVVTRGGQFLHPGQAVTVKMEGGT